METGYVLFTLKSGTKKDFLSAIKTLKEVKEARLTLGTFDAIAKIEGENIEKLEQIYFNKIDKIVGIARSRFHIVACPRLRK